MKRSLSGDRLYVLSFLTLKSGSPLVAQQGRIMDDIHSLQSSCIPKIYHVGKTWYAMETVRETAGPIGYHVWNWRTAAHCMNLYWYIPENWIYADASPFKAQRLLDYIEEQGWLRNLDMPSLNNLRSMYENAPPRLTHGDLTHENTVIDYRGYYKFIDWQAKRHPYIAPHPDVDYGKLLQSLIGWDKDSPWRTERMAKEVYALLKECPMAAFWCAIHFMRIKVRAKEEWQKTICDDAIDYCSWLTAEVVLT